MRIGRTLQFVLPLTPENERPGTGFCPLLDVELVDTLRRSVVREAVRVVRWAARQRSESGAQYENHLGAETVEYRDLRLIWRCWRWGGDDSSRNDLKCIFHSETCSALALEAQERGGAHLGHVEEIWSEVGEEPSDFECANSFKLVIRSLAPTKLFPQCS